jgi:excisionase family DNA binding protein
LLTLALFQVNIMKRQPFLMPSEVASLLGVSPVTVRKWAYRGELKCHLTPGGHRRFSRAAIESFVRDKDISCAADGQQSLRVLVVENDRQFARYLFESLQQVPRFDVTIAYDGFEAGRQLQKTAPEIVLLDILLPGVDGYEVCRQLSEDPETAHTRIIAMTGSYSADVAARIKRCGVDHCLSKPFSLDTLLLAIEDVDNSIEIRRA